MPLSSLINAFFIIATMALVWPQAHAVDDDVPISDSASTKLDDVFVRNSEFVRAPRVDLYEATRGAEIALKKRETPRQRTLEVKSAERNAGGRVTSASSLDEAQRNPRATFNVRLAP